MASFTITVNISTPDNQQPPITYAFKVRNSFDSGISFTAGLRDNWSEVFRAELSRPENVVDDWQYLVQDIVGRVVSCHSVERNGKATDFTAFVSDETSLTGDTLLFACYILYPEVQGDLE